MQGTGIHYIVLLLIILGNIQRKMVKPQQIQEERTLAFMERLHRENGNLPVANVCGPVHVLVGLLQFYLATTLNCSWLGSVTSRVLRLCWVRILLF